MNEELKQLSKSLSSNMFADRPSVSEALDYAGEIIKGLRKEERVYAYTALQVVMNTIANEINRIVSKNETTK